jgi:SRSO17 transposase
MGCAGGIDNGINTVHLAYVGAGFGHALIASRQWIPAEQISDPVKAITMALPPALIFATKGELAINLLRDAFSDGVHLDFVAGDEVYGACTTLRTYAWAWIATASSFHCLLVRKRPGPGTSPPL